MIVRVAPSTGSVALDEPTDFTSFSVQAEANADRADVADALDTPLPDLDGHVWVSVDQLRELAPSSSPTWHRDFDKMLQYAATKDWLSPDQACILAHLA